MLPTIAREDDVVVMIDQRKLPSKEIYVRCKTAAEVARAIKTMVIRGAPEIGVAAAYGLAIGLRASKATGTQKLATEFYKCCEMMAATRPTAVNLFWAIDRMKRAFASGVEAGESVDQLKDRLDREAQLIHDEDVASCRANDMSFIPLVAPTSRDARIELLAKVADSWMYCVSVTGTTGGKAIDSNNDLPGFIARVRNHTSLPLTVGFGVNTRAQADNVRKVADAVAVGTAIIAAIDAAPAEERANRVREFVEDVSGR